MSDVNDAFEAYQAFDSFDADGNGQIDLIEFRKLIAKLGAKLDDARAEELFDAIDSDETGLIDRDEFAGWWKDACLS